MTQAQQRVCVLYGGRSSERDVSIASGKEVTSALQKKGYDVYPFELGHSLQDFIEFVTLHKPHVVFNALHGRYGEDGAIQGVLEWLNVPYTHSGIYASALAMDKAASRIMLQAAGLPVAEGGIYSLDELKQTDPLPFPYVIKPVNEGSSVGVHIIFPEPGRTNDSKENILSRWSYGNKILVEAFIPGRELTVGVLEDRALTVTDITPTTSTERGFYDYEAKYNSGGSLHKLPAHMPPALFQQALSLAVQAHKVLGCSGASRTDFRYDDTITEKERLIILEVNTQPGMTPTSLLPEQAAFCNISYEELCSWMLDNALCRT